MRTRRRSKWTKEELIIEARKYQTKTEFKQYSSGAYTAAYNNNWLNEICQHMKKVRFPKGYLTKERCMSIASKYNTRSGFAKGHNAAYNAAIRYGWLEDVCKHMKIQGNRKKRCLYVCKFPDGAIYIGLTYNFENRKSDRQLSKRDTVTRYAKLTGQDYEMIQLTDYMESTLAAEKEISMIAAEREKGTIVLNVDKGGGLGKIDSIWTYESVLAEAKKYTTRNQFKKISKSAYRAAQRQGWLKKVCSHMVQADRTRKYNYEVIKKEAEKYSSRVDFQKGSRSVYNAAITKGCLDEVCKHMTRLVNPVGHWSFENCKKEALSFKTRSEFQYGHPAAYSAAQKNGWLDEICKHMKKLHMTWDENSIKELALSCQTLTEFNKKSSAAYRAAKRLGILEEVTKHMKKNRKTWDFSSIKVEALKYSSKKDFFKGSGSAYNAAKKLGIFEEITSHMPIRAEMRKS
ncbi:hypothetical protein [Carboxylicivirga sp. RSCT41]|uniref:hypothetical protein n=1 Tax=Carboxylicivirga agarovorans TaxID=3417570 RepID=UPI003D340192